MAPFVSITRWEVVRFSGNLNKKKVDGGTVRVFYRREMREKQSVPLMPEASRIRWWWWTCHPTRHSRMGG